ncbi:hypothetical protein PM082_003658 [Marasmius tenuissimus]|nr:hypothetical protein PM082_003658 [Marasmius tenuissimus]
MLSRLNDGDIQFLYSLYSETCIIEPAFKAKGQYPLDVFVSPRFVMSKLVDSRFQEIDDDLTRFDAKKLDEAAPRVNASTAGTGPSTPGHIIVWLTSWNYSAGRVWDTPVTTLPSSIASENTKTANPAQSTNSNGSVKQSLPLFTNFAFFMMLV